MNRRALSYVAITAMLAAAAPVGAARLILSSVPEICAVEEGDPVTIQISMADLGADAAAGVQAFIQYDTARLAFVDGSYTPAPFGLPIVDPIVASGGFIDVASGVDIANGQMPSSADSLLIELNFTVLAGSGAPVIGFVSHKPPTRLSDDQGIEIETLLEGFPSPSCPADLNGNGDVGFGDIVILLKSWGEECPGDLIPDGVVNIEDLIELLVSWGPCDIF